MAAELSPDLLDWCVYEDSDHNVTAGDRDRIADTPLGFEQIRVLEVRIEALQEKAQDRRGKRHRRDRQSLRLIKLEQRLCRITSAHNQVAEVIQEQAHTFAALPRELRDTIYEQLYVQEEPIEVNWHRVGRKTLFDMPADTGLYMSQFHVGQNIAREAAELFYMKNRFKFSGRDGSLVENWSQNMIDLWFNTDHYRSGVLPMGHVRHLEANLSAPSQSQFDAVLYWNEQTFDFKICSHVTLEEACRASEADGYAYRNCLRALFSVPTLRTIKLPLLWNESGLDLLLRMINPVVRESRAAGLKFELIVIRDGCQTDWTDIFDEPTDQDFALYLASSKRPFIFSDDPERDLFDTWKVVQLDWHCAAQHMPGRYDLSEESRALVRVWLHEHNQVHKTLRRVYGPLKTLDIAAEEFKNMTTISKDLRRNYYHRIMDYLR